MILAALALGVVASLAHGANPVPYGQVWSVLWSRDGSEAEIIVWAQRWPRTIVAVAVGAALGVAGALIQALTRNPLADPGILGVNAGAGFAVTLGAGLFGLTGIAGYVWFAFLGAAVATVLVFAIGSAGGGTASPVTLVLAGVALAAVLNGLSTFLTLIDEETFRAFRNWGLGSIARTGLDDTLLVAPFLVLGLLGAIALSGSLNSIALGDDLAASLGTRVARTRVLGVVVVTLLAGGATALTGGIAFVGLMVPHVVRWLVGPDQRWIIVYSALAAPVLILLADVLGRVVVRPGEVEVGVVTALVGAPVMELFRNLHSEGRTIVTVLHDLNQAARYADHLIVMRDGRVVTTGSPSTVITSERVEEIFGLPCLVVADPVTGTPTVVPLDPRTAPVRTPEDTP